MISTFEPTGPLPQKAQNICDRFRNDPVKMQAEMCAHWPELRTDATKHDAVRNENTFSSSLTTNYLILSATTQASPKFASVKMFSRDPSVDPYKPLATGE